MASRRWWGWGYAGFFLNGLGTVLLGPLLPRLESLWHLSDGEGGALLAAQFLGMTLGTVFVRRRRREAMAVGSVCACAGIATLALLVRIGGSLPGVEGIAFAALLVHGTGLGQAITTLNLGMGAEAEGRSARLSFGNAMWSVGAIVAPLVVSAALASGHSSVWLLAVAVSFPAVWLRHFGPAGDRETVRGEDEKGVTAGLVGMFALLMFLYGSAEASLSGWVTAFARRAGGAGALVSPLSVSAFWIGVAGGRALAAAWLSKWRGRHALLLLVGGAAAASLGLVSGRSMASIALWAALAGMMLGPAFPVVLAGVLDRGANRRQTGLVLASCGVGAAVMPFALGVVSERVGSLREALVLPGVCLVGMLVVVGVSSSVRGRGVV